MSFYDNYFKEGSKWVRKSGQSTNVTKLDRGYSEAMKELLHPFQVFNERIRWGNITCTMYCGSVDPDCGKPDPYRHIWTNPEHKGNVTIDRTIRSALGPYNPAIVIEPCERSKSSAMSSFDNLIDYTELVMLFEMVSRSEIDNIIAFVRRDTGGIELDDFGGPYFGGPSSEREVIIVSDYNPARRILIDEQSTLNLRRTKFVFVHYPKTYEWVPSMIEGNPAVKQVKSCDVIVTPLVDVSFL